jgi:hypothetical protein
MPEWVSAMSRGCSPEIPALEIHDDAQNTNQGDIRHRRHAQRNKQVLEG